MKPEEVEAIKSECWTGCQCTKHRLALALEAAQREAEELRNRELKLIQLLENCMILASGYLGGWTRQASEAMSAALTAAKQQALARTEKEQHGKP